MWRVLARRAADHAGLAILLVLVWMGASAWGDLRDVRAGLQEQNRVLDKVLGRVAQMTTFTTTWRSGGAEHTVSTTCRENESVDDCLRRHEDAVAAMQEIHPPDPPR